MQEDMTSAAAYYPHQSMIMTAKQQQQPELPEQEQLNCPRCASPNTKFCYYNNYNLSQPRHFCKTAVVTGLILFNQFQNFDYYFHLIRYLY
ncbi:hypothetical protein Bca52824_038756 [Brassica carinata]|uniref:Dof-type domain-containing protein n=1 Tax=Brassica carinata TaxID=52824 RepID=A0A8X7RQ87_BRACI|nr:hypothetical protein Bca52824_038756 [Brassica carinata]